MITRRDVGQKIERYLYHQINLEELVDWAEEAMREEEFEEAHLETLRDVIGRLGLADVRAFGLTWEDCEKFLECLGYQVKVKVTEAN